MITNYSPRFANIASLIIAICAFGFLASSSQASIYQLGLSELAGMKTKPDVQTAMIDFAFDGVTLSVTSFGGHNLFDGVSPSQAVSVDTFTLTLTFDGLVPTGGHLVIGGAVGTYDGPILLESDELLAYRFTSTSLQLLFGGEIGGDLAPIFSPQIGVVISTSSPFGGTPAGLAAASKYTTQSNTFATTPEPASVVSWALLGLLSFIYRRKPCD